MNSANLGCERKQQQFDLIDHVVRVDGEVVLELTDVHALSQLHAGYYHDTIAMHTSRIEHNINTEHKRMYVKDLHVNNEH